MTLLRLMFVALVLLALLRARQGGEPRELDPGMHHLGDGSMPEWTEAPAAPEGGGLDFTFTGRALGRESTLELTQRNVNEAWFVELNGVRVFELERVAELVVRHYALPAGLLRDGENTFRLVGDVPTDDITIGRVRLHPRSLREVLDLVPVVVTVRDADSGAALPARLTIVDAAGALARTYFSADPLSAVRAGVVYQAGGTARFELPRGAYTVYATRGMEWGLATGALAVGAGSARADLALRREVDTTGFIACDTHVHTLTHSGHGDASVEERQVTLAGEGVELAIATDHNHHTDYRPAQRELGLTAWYTSVVGNEVTTDIGHFNGFPLDPAGPVPAHTSKDVVEVVAGMRAAGAQVVILNHPRWPAGDSSPFGASGLDRFTGASRSAHPYDALELVNSDNDEPDPMVLFRDWFSLLDRGERLVAVASSDSHHVGVMVGGGRTYIRSSSDDPARLDVDELARSLAIGRSTLSLGIFADVRMDGTFGLADLVPSGAGREHTVSVSVRSPGWVRPTFARLWVNGRLAGELQVPTTAGAATACALEFKLPGADFDAWLVCIVSGDGIGGPWWPLHNDYTLAATNPVYLDGDGDGRYSPPRETARRLLEQGGSDPAALGALLARVDGAVGLQALDLARAAWLGEVETRLEAVAREAAGSPGRLRDWLNSRGL